MLGALVKIQTVLKSSPISRPRRTYFLDLGMMLLMPFWHFKAVCVGESGMKSVVDEQQMLRSE